MQKLGSRLLDATSHKLLFWMDQYKLMAQWLRQVVVS